MFHATKTAAFYYIIYHFCPGKGNLLLVQFLLRRGAAIDPRDCAMRTPLHVAARAARHELVAELISVGADVTAVQSAGQTPLHLAASNDMTGELTVTLSFVRSFVRSFVCSFVLSLARSFVRSHVCSLAIVDEINKL